MKNKNILIRKAGMSDVKGLAELYLQFWEKHSNMDPLTKLKTKPTLRNNIHEAKKDVKKKNNVIFVALIDDKIAGYIEIYIKKNFRMFRIKEYAYIDSATTHKDYRGLGVARMLTEASIKYLKEKKIKYVRVNVYTSNKIALKVWRKLGFRPQSIKMIKEI